MRAAISWSSVVAMSAPAESVLGAVQLSQVAGFSVWTEPLLTSFSRLLNEVT